ncbi:NAD(P)H-quinone oxidoreductase [Acinetobacter qingfengensis]|uniref:NAD(P)H-quinone oxidoreductase n=1 Tax=Acinetobacter qingfengensis TaxID=1262585 RepID=A0A1E7RCA6_9GAMM|nr:NAD(P)H-quinone oxidoreductase [Acinetobacter qingfengensis]KAA8734962.1 NAD(P)H-quinone oxidoreductase [Acinetobacter qingfengensis]OEY97049.1 NAD(P)H-quinone oxidoreductase [Acinetobacter qingfengensis]
MQQQQMNYIEIIESGGPEVLQIRQTDIPQPKADEVLIKVRAAGINRPDILQRKGLYPMPKGVTNIPGLEVAGDVVAIGGNVQRFQIGDQVCALTNGGGYAEYCVVDVTQVLHKPKNLTYVEAAAIPETYFTVWVNIFSIGRLQKYETALIHGGASGIGSTALSLCKAMGIRAFATVGAEDKVQALADFGHIINYKTQDFEQEILQQTEQKGVDVILDIVGASYFNKNINLLKKDGRLVIIGFMGGRYADKVDLQAIMLKRLIVTGSTMRARDQQEKQKIAEDLEHHVWPLIETGQCKPLVYKTFNFEDVQQAHQCMEASQHIGKIVLDLEQT